MATQLRHLKKSEYAVGWICALPIELAAAKTMLDEVHGPLSGQDSADSNTYTLGSMGEHNLVIACLPPGRYGTTSATLVAKDMIQTFSKSLRICLMVGIGGGIPAPGIDIRLGDIVVSQPVDACAGVLQYDMGKFETGGHFRRTGALNGPPRSLLTAVGRLSADALTDEPNYPSYITQAIEKNARTRKNFNQPSVNKDRLFHFEYNHKEELLDCVDCDADREIKRPLRDESYPEVHCGIIASGNAVVKDGKFREKLRKETGALCFEMETAGLMEDFPCLVIRGICDYSDSHKNKEWQGYAAIAAAAYAKDLLLHIPQREVVKEAPVIEVCASIDKGIENLTRVATKASDLQQEQLDNGESQLNDECHQMFKTSQYELYKNINITRAEGTCEWVLSHEKYLRWRDYPENDLLWISADPGCGKSVLARSLVDTDLWGTCEPVKTICYFFFKENDIQSNITTALCAVLHQLFSEQPKLLSVAMPAYRKNGHALQSEVDELWKILEEALSHHDANNVICIMDALDECDQRGQEWLIEKLSTFYIRRCKTTQGPWLKFLITSRPYENIRSTFQKAMKYASSLLPEIRLRGEDANEEIGEEINIVVRHRVAQLAEELSLREETRFRLEEELLNMHHRTYLWLHLAIDDIRHDLKNSLDPNRVPIKSVPPSVEKAYEKILNRVPPPMIQTVRKVLMIIVGARRPLTVRELAYAIGTLNATPNSRLQDILIDESHFEHYVREWCGLFIFLNRSRVHLIHQTAKSFLLKDKASSSEWTTMGEYKLTNADIEYSMADICTKFLLIHEVTQLLVFAYQKSLALQDDTQARPTRKQMIKLWDTWATHQDSKHPRVRDAFASGNHEITHFTQYALEQWVFHSKHCKLVLGGGLAERILQLHDRNHVLFATWSSYYREIYFWHEKWSIAEEFWNTLDALSVAVVTGLVPTADSSVEVRHQVENDSYVKDWNVQTALQLAVRLGAYDMFERLLDLGGNVNARTGTEDTPLGIALSKRKPNTVEFLLRHHADPDLPVTQGGILPLHLASSQGNPVIVELLLDYGAHVDALSGTNLATPLSPVSEILLQRGADVNIKDMSGRTALHIACMEDNVALIRSLIERGADINAEDMECRTPLYAASICGHRDSAEILLGSYAVADTRSVEVLLKSYAVADTGTDGLEPPLIAALMRHHFEIFRVLLPLYLVPDSQRCTEEAATEKINRARLRTVFPFVSNHQLTPQTRLGQKELYDAFFVAIYYGLSRPVELLIESGVNVNVCCTVFGTPLHLAISRRYGDIVKLLLDAGANLEASTWDIGTAVGFMSARGSIDVNLWAGGKGCTLFAASLRGYTEVVRLLLRAGALPDGLGGCVAYMEILAQNLGYTQIADQVSPAGVVPRSERNAFVFPLQGAAFHGHQDVVEALIEGGADVNMQGGTYGNALQAACASGCSFIVNLLLEAHANVNAVGGLFGTPLCAASRNGHVATVTRLLKAGADVNKVPTTDGSALHIAARYGHDLVIDALLASGADVNAVNGPFATPLQAASGHGHRTVVQTLLDTGADVNAQGGQFGNALIAASGIGNLDIVQLLLSAGANAQDTGNEAFGSALDIAEALGHEAVVQCLRDWRPHGISTASVVSCS